MSKENSGTHDNSTFSRRFLRIIIIVGVSIVGLITGMFFTFAVLPSRQQVQTPEEIAATSVTFGKTLTETVTAPPRRELADGVPYVPLSIAGTGTRKVELPDLTVQADGVLCDITETLGLYRSGGGTYCVIPLLLTVQGKNTVTISAINQLVYGVPPRVGSPDGYRSTFFIDENNERVETITVDPGKARNVRLITDVHTGFLANQLLPQEH